MLVIDTDAARAEELLVAIGRHLPHGFDMGRPRIVTTVEVLTGAGGESAVFSLDEGGTEVSRLVGLPGGLAEVTRWAYGEETGRRIVHAGPDDDGRGGDTDGPDPATGPGPAEPPDRDDAQHGPGCGEFAEAAAGWLPGPARSD